MKISVTAKIERLNLGELKCIEIARAISSNPKTLLLDESTAYLDHREVDAVLHVIQELKSTGMAIGFVSHHLSEVVAAADDLTILKDGQFVGSYGAASIKQNEIHRLMVGRDVAAWHLSATLATARLRRCPRPSRQEGRGRPGTERNQSRSPTWRDLGLAGLKGAGAEALFAGIVGDQPLRHGDLQLEGKDYHPSNPRAAWRHGIAHLPGDRGNEGLIVITERARQPGHGAAAGGRSLFLHGPRPRDVE